MYCPKCHSEILDDSDFCVYCGANVRETTFDLQNTQVQPPASAIPDSMKTTNKVAIAALVCGIIPVTALVGFVLAVIAMFMIDADRARQKGMNLAVIAGMLSVFWGIVLIFGVFYMANKETRGQFGASFMEGMKSGVGIQNTESTVFTLIPKFETSQNVNPEQLTLLVRESENMIRLKLQQAKIAKSVSTTSLAQTIIVRLYELKDEQKAKAIMTDPGLPIQMQIASQSKTSPNPFAGNNKEEDAPGYQQQ